MDEQAGPGVFPSFGSTSSNNNNHSHAGLAGAVNSKAAPSGEFGGGGSGEATRAHYNIPGILHFLQHEWARFEVQRAQWEVERAELQVKRLRVSDITPFAS